jgi:hypothetical protein
MIAGELVAGKPVGKSRKSGKWDGEKRVEMGKADELLIPKDLYPSRPGI